MKYNWLFCLILAFCFIVVCRSSYSYDKRQKGDVHTIPRCPRYQFYNVTGGTCLDCSLCGPGTYLKSECQGLRDNKCRPCKRGSFTTMYSKRPGRCRICTHCGKREVIRKCTKKADTICGDCPLGSYWDALTLHCVPCSYCFTDVYPDISIEGRCKTPAVPVTHQCRRIRWPPYHPPPLIAKVDQNGKQYFVVGAWLGSKLSTETSTDNKNSFGTKSSIARRATTTVPESTGGHEDNAVDNSEPRICIIAAIIAVVMVLVLAIALVKTRLCAGVVISRTFVGFNAEHRQNMPPYSKLPSDKHTGHIFVPSRK